MARRRRVLRHGASCALLPLSEPLICYFREGLHVLLFRETVIKTQAMFGPRFRVFLLALLVFGFMFPLVHAGDGFLTSNPYALQKRRLMPFLNSIGKLTFNIQGNSSRRPMQLLERRLELVQKNSPEDPYDYCTGFLVGPNHVATANHCMHQDIEARKNINVCSASDFRMEASEKFGAPHSKFFQTACRNLSWNNPTLDQALIELETAADETVFKPLVFNRTQVAIGDTVFILSLRRDWVSKFFWTTPGHINACKVLAFGDDPNQFRFKDEIGDLVDHFVKMECEWPAYQGESGSPIVNENGEVVGILSSSQAFGLPTGEILFRSTISYFSPVYTEEN